ncbi:hypothetical protein [Aureimonas sp. Leaf454]|uniref:hypothetical protein n=1 Tax=Aureimonas sp. Leaf454 TaxID=1736381 RepID=UPI000B2D7B5B|nr:hypothetical protein [Aureimonas sp. Leaf454]
MSAVLSLGPDKTGGALTDAFSSVEFEIALDLQDPVLASFESCVRAAASVVGGEFLFEMPADGTASNASRIAAVRIPASESPAQPSQLSPSKARDTILFAVLDASGTRLRIADRQEIAERFHGFARAFVGVLERLRDHRSGLPAEGPSGSA